MSEINIATCRRSVNWTDLSTLETDLRDVGCFNNILEAIVEALIICSLLFFIQRQVQIRKSSISHIIDI